MTDRSVASRRRGAAFSLIEVLMVISILALLLGILSPALMATRERARAAVCSTGIRQLQLANDLHASDHQEAYVPGAVEFQTRNLHRWHGTRDSRDQPFDPVGGPITPYLGGAGASEQIRACPSFADDLDRLRASGAGFESGAGGYGYNNTFVGQVRRMTHPGIWAVESDREGSRRWRFASPSRTIAFTDAAYAPSWDDSEPAEYSFAEPRFWPENPAYRPEPTIHFRHSGSASVAWLDGHVDAQVRTRGAGNPTGAPGSSDRLVGWFGAADDNSLFDYD